ncbi:hypothetical protein AcW1_002618 [Taiwanofungus camphoratus]|nr:hypothetical protein AcV5_009701 [Antrodia cinnamomea]KAI0942844.1 hypothetical protein AcV7_002142 [Antrodia cinnamomea]KAI0943463.1 hypothetical protein AcW1_002618 [Antrodia cinnamomea]
MADPDGVSPSLSDHVPPSLFCSPTLFFRDQADSGCTSLGGNPKSYVRPPSAQALLETGRHVTAEPTVRATAQSELESLTVTYLMQLLGMARLQCGLAEET